MRKPIQWCALLLLVLATGFAGALPPGERAKEVQARLQELGFDPGLIDGMPGAKTRKALMDFQRSSGLEATGELDAATEKMLFPAGLVLYTQDFYPFHYRHPISQELIGPGIELVSEACRQAGLDCTLRIGDGSWDETQDKVRAGGGDGLFLIGWNAGREQWLVRTDRVLSTAYGFFVHDGDPIEFTGPESLDGYTIGVFGPSNTATTLDKLIVTLRSQNVRLIKEMMPDDEPVMRKLNEGPPKYAMYSNRDVGKALARRLGFDHIRYAGRHKCITYYVGITKAHQGDGTVERIDAALRKMESEGLTRRLLAPYGLGHCEDDAASAPAPAREARPEPTPEPTPAPCAEASEGGDKVIRCPATCLTWEPSGSESEMTWGEAKGPYLDDLNGRAYAGIRDWRLPTREELETILTKDVDRESRMFVAGVFGSRLTDVWTGTLDTSSGREDVFYVDFYAGQVVTKSASDSNFVRAVHGSLCR